MLVVDLEGRKPGPNSTSLTRGLGKAPYTVYICLRVFPR